jgi:predicted ATPase
VINKIKLMNFKCFRDSEISLSPLSLLTGVNGTGKSSLIQSMLLLRQSSYHLASDGLALNGPMISLGTVRDIRNEYTNHDWISFSLQDNNNEYNWRFASERSDDEFCRLLDGPTEIPNISIFNNEFLHLSAERIGPRILYPLSSHTGHSKARDHMRSDGSLAVSWFQSMKYSKVAPQLLHLQSKSESLEEQADQWLGEVSPGVRLSSSALDNKQFVELTYEFSNFGIKSQKYRPNNVGFGLSYTLPIILACLSAKPRKILLLENPEAHLHPRGQMAMGELIARAASTGAQVIVETHSDHLLNGVRLAVKERLVQPDDVAVHFFSRRADGEAIVHECHSPKIDKSGRLSEWPEGFFDQYDTALERLL